MRARHLNPLTDTGKNEDRSKQFQINAGENNFTSDESEEDDSGELMFVVMVLL